MDSDKIIESISKELESASKEIQKTNELEKKVQLSIVIKNLSESLSVFSSMPCSGYQADDISEEDEFEINSALDEKLK